MPRKRKPAGPSNQGGYGAQPIAEPTGRPYGERKESVDSQRAMPLPQDPGPQAGPAPAGPASPAGAPAPDPEARLEAAMRTAQRMRAPQPLFGPTTRPGEPITAGMPTGAGPGPEVLRTGDRVARTFRQLAEASGDARFEQLAELAAMRQR